MENITLDEFTTALIGKVRTLLDTNDARPNPLGRRDIIWYVKGAVDWFLFVSGNPEKADADCVMSNIVIDAGVLDRLPPENRG